MSNLYVVFDTETGGLDENKYDLLTAFFCIMDENHKVIDELDLKLKPNDGRLPIAEAGALAVNKIDIKQHLENPETLSYADGEKKLEAFLKKHLKKNGRFSNLIPMGYNILGFDIRWVQKHLFPTEKWLNTLHYKSRDVMVEVDFLKRAQWFPPTLGSLETVANHLQVPSRNAHNAREDVMMTIDVARKIMDLMAAKKNGGDTQDLISLLEEE